MREERRAILSLIAMGRISASEAERLMTAWCEDRIVLLLAAAGVVLCGIQALVHGAAPGIGHLVHALAPGLASSLSAALSRAAAVLLSQVGGM